MLRFPIFIRTTNQKKSGKTGQRSAQKKCDKIKVNIGPIPIRIPAVEDCIYCLDKLMLDQNIKSQVFNIGPDEETITINELYSMIANKMKFNLDPIYNPDRPNEVKFASCSSEKSRRLLNYSTKVELSESIDRLITYIKKTGPKNFDYNLKLEIVTEKTPKTWSKKLF